MAMEHLNEHGQLSQGYFCSRCGKGTGMYGHMKQDCEPNPALVKKLREINAAGSYKQYIFNKLKEENNE